MPRRIFQELEHDRPFSTFVGGVDLTQPLRNLDAPLAKIDAGIDFGLDPLNPDAGKAKNIIEGKYGELSQVSNIDPFLQASTITRMANQWKNNINDRSTEEGAIMLSTKQRGEGVKNLQSLKDVDSEDIQFNIARKDSEFKRRGGTMPSKSGLGYDTYGEMEAPPKIVDAFKVIDDLSKGFAVEGREGAIIQQDNTGTLVQGGTPGQWVIKTETGWESVSPKDVASFAGTAIKQNREIGAFYTQQAEKNAWTSAVNSMISQGVPSEQARDEAFKMLDGGELQREVQNNLNNLYDEVANQMANKYGFTKTEVSKSFQANRLFEEKGLEDYKNNQRTLTISTEGGLMEGDMANMKELTSTISNNNKRIQELKAAQLTERGIKPEEAQELLGLQKSTRIAERTRDAYLGNYLTSNQGNEQIKEIFKDPKSTGNIFSGIDSIDKRTEENKAFNNKTDGLFSREYGNIRTEEELIEVLRGTKRLSEEILNKEYDYGRMTPGAGGAVVSEGTITVRDAIDLMKNRLSEPATKYSESNPISFKARRLDDETLNKGDQKYKGIYSTSNELLLNNIEGGNFTVNGIDDLQSWLSNNFYKDYNLNKGDFEFKAHVLEEPLNGEEAYSFTIIPQSDKAKSEFTQKQIYIYPKDGLSMASNIADGELDAASTGSGLQERHARGEYLGDLPIWVSGSGESQQGKWRNKDERDFYKRGFYRKAYGGVGNRFKEATYLNQRDLIFPKDKERDGASTLIPLDGTTNMNVKVTLTKSPQGVLTPSYNLVNNNGHTYFGEDYSSLNDLIIHTYINRTQIPNL